METIGAVVSVIVCLFVTTVFSSTLHGQIHILLAPSSYVFRGNEPLRLSNLENAISLFMGRSFEPKPWTGLKLTNPFDFCQSVVVLHIPGLTSFSVESLGSYPLIRDKSVDTIVYRASYFDDSKVVYLDENESVRKAYHVKIRSDAAAAPPEFFGSPMNSYDSFLEQLDLLSEIGRKLSENEQRGRVHWIGFTGCRLMNRMHANDRAPALSNLINTIKKVARSLEANKNVRYLFAIVNYPSDASVRRKREDVPAADSPSTQAPATTNTTINSTTEYSPDDEYGPPMFNLIFWSFFAWFLILYGICIGFWNMNPGSQHAFYRITEMKMKTE